jgi:hypothetical protein
MPVIWEECFHEAFDFLVDISVQSDPEDGGEENSLSSPTGHRDALCYAALRDSAASAAERR